MGTGNRDGFVSLFRAGQGRASGHDLYRNAECCPQCPPGTRKSAAPMLGKDHRAWRGGGGPPSEFQKERDKDPSV